MKILRGSRSTFTLFSRSTFSDHTMNSLTRQYSANTSPSPDVIIVGAGMAGLAAAARLQSMNVNNFLVLDARKRVGGRIRSIDFRGAMIEMGPSLLETKASNPLYPLALDHRILCLPHPPKRWPLETEIMVLTKSDSPYSFETTQNAWKITQTCIKKTTNAAYFQCSSLTGKSFEHVFKINLTKELEMFSPVIRKTLKKLCMLMVKAQLNDYGASLKKLNFGALSYRELVDKEMCMEVPEGMEFIMERMAESLPPNALRLNTIVNTIRPSESEEEGMEVVTEGGQVLSCDYVICALPLPVIRENVKTLFPWGFSEWRQCALSNVGCGYVTRLHLYYKYPFWPRGEGTFYLQPKNTDSHHWLNNVSYIEEGPTRNFLTITLSGAPALSLETEGTSNILKVMSQAGLHFRAYFRDPSLGMPSDAMVSSWNKNPYTMGQPYIPEEFDMDNIEILGEPLCQDDIPTVFFAGDYTNKQGFGTFKGAYLSGIRAAEGALASMEVPDTCPKEIPSCCP